MEEVQANPFNPQSPVDPNFFVGRKEALKDLHIYMQESLEGQRINTIFIRGERGIGKTSLAKYFRSICEKTLGITSFYLLLNERKENISGKDFVLGILEKIIEFKSSEKNFLKKLQSVSGFLESIDLGIIKLKLREVIKNSPDDTRELLIFLDKINASLKSEGSTGLLIILDEIENLNSKESIVNFTRTISDISDELTIDKKIVFIICGSIETYEQIHNSDERIGDFLKIIDVSQLNQEEVKEFYRKTFALLRCNITDKALALLAGYCSGYPQIMQRVGYEVFKNLNLRNRPSNIDLPETSIGINEASKSWAKSHLLKIDYEDITDKRFKLLAYTLRKIQTDLFFSENRLKNEITNKDDLQAVLDAIQLLEISGILKRGKQQGEWSFKDRLLSLFIQNIGIAE